MADGGALVQHNAPGLLELGDDRAGRVAGRLDNLDALVNHHLGVGVVVGRNKSRKKGDVDTKGARRHLFALSDLLAQAFGLRPDQGRDDAQTAGIGHGARHFGVAYMLPRGRHVSCRP